MLYLKPDVKMFNTQSHNKTLDTISKHTWGEGGVGGGCVEKTSYVLFSHCCFEIKLIKHRPFCISGDGRINYLYVSLVKLPNRTDPADFGIYGQQFLM